MFRSVNSCFESFLDLLFSDEDLFSTVDPWGLFSAGTPLAFPPTSPQAGKVVGVECMQLTLLRTVLGSRLIRLLCCWWRREKRKCVFFLKWGPFLKSLLTLLQHCFCFMFWFLGQEACGILVPRPGIEPRISCPGRQSLNHWTAGEVPKVCLLFFFIVEWISVSLYDCFWGFVVSWPSLPLEQNVFLDLLLGWWCHRPCLPVFSGSILRASPAPPPPI